MAPRLAPLPRSCRASTVTRLHSPLDERRGQRHILTGAVGGFAANYLLQHLRELQDRKRYSQLGASIIGYLTAQVDAGIKVLQEGANGKLPLISMPQSAWADPSILPREVLLRIVALDRVTRQSDTGIPYPRDILIHCNNYFVNVCGNMNRKFQTAHQRLSQGAEPDYCDLQSASRAALKSAERLKCTFDRTKKLLERNALKFFPR